MPARRAITILCALAALAGPAAGIAESAESLAASLDELGRGVGIEATASPGADTPGRVDSPVVVDDFADPGVGTIRPDRPRHRSTPPRRASTPGRRLALFQVYRC